VKKLRDRILTVVLTVTILITIASVGTVMWAYESKVSDQKDVRLEIIPVKLVPGSQAQFKISMNTHSIELNYDMVKLSTLKDDRGREYQALKWKGAPPAGHHRSGVLEFTSIARDAKSITLRIINIAGVPERIFEWKVEQ
jgi:hypothetical protein